MERQIIQAVSANNVIGFGVWPVDDGWLYQSSDGALYPVRGGYFGPLATREDAVEEALGWVLRDPA
ncbi:MAG: hypothetical protein ACPG6R_10870 [Aequoribacter sp.]|uniref:hypothetical protein n=1 Tax=Aequoribacter sp. TaxID=2847771 RepID=UPI003C67C38F